jgi:thiamine monophosphate synthase
MLVTSDTMRNNEKTSSNQMLSQSVSVPLVLVCATVSVLVAILMDGSSLSSGTIIFVKSLSLTNHNAVLRFHQHVKNVHRCTWCHGVLAPIATATISTLDIFMLHSNQIFSDDHVYNDMELAEMSADTDETTLSVRRPFSQLSLSSRFVNHHHPLLAIVTEETACDEDKSMAASLHAIQQAISTGDVAIVVIRVCRPEQEVASICTQRRSRVKAFIENVMQLSTNCAAAAPHQQSFHVCVSSDWMDVALEVGVHGIHVKEHHRSKIPTIRSITTTTNNNNNRSPDQTLMMIGISAHSISSALVAYRMFHPDYFFIGTCYVTPSHPEKHSLNQIEGPQLPGKVVQALEFEMKQEKYTTTSTSSLLDPHQRHPHNGWRPKVLAIGGINITNCHEPVSWYGADGVAVIRSVLCAPDPATVVRLLRQRMNR